MIRPQIKERSLNIVLIGDFNPHIFQPFWFILQRLLGTSEGESAKVEVVHSDITVFNLDWLRFEVTRTRLVAVTKDDRYYDILKDLIIGTFSILSHTPLKMLGVNNTFDCLVSDEEIWHNIGHKLAPKDIWNKVIDSPGLLSLTVVSKPEIKDGYKNIVRVSVGPAEQKLTFRLHINDHYETTPDVKNSGSDKILSVLKDEWGNSQKKALEIKDKLFEELP